MFVSQTSSTQGKMNIGQLYLVLSLMVILPGYGIYARKQILGRIGSDEITNTSIAEKAAGCKISDLRITECDIKVSRLGNQRFGAKYKKTCTLREYSFVFSFGKDGKYFYSIFKQKPQLTFKDMKKELDKRKKKILAGTHYIYVVMKAKSLKNVEMTLESGKCTFFVNYENPEAYCGRTNRNVRSNVSFTVDCRKSRNYDLSGTIEGLEFRWSCTDTVGFCNGRNLGIGTSVVVNKQYAKEGANFTFNVEVRTQYSDWQKSILLFHVNSAHPFNINCIASCGKDPNILNPRLKPHMIAECQFDCKKYGQKKVDGVATYIGSARTGFALHGFDRGPKVFIPIPDTTLIFKAYYNSNGRHILAEQIFSVYPLPKLKNCKSLPAEGNPLTKFKMECNYDKNVVENFEIQVKSEGTVVFSTNSKKLEDIQFMIPRASTVTVNLRDKNYVEVGQTVAVKINPIIESNKKIAEANEHLTEILEGKVEGSHNVDSLIASGNFSNAVQIIDVVARELANIPVTNKEEKEVATNLKKKLLTSLTEFPMNSFAMTKSVSGVISVLANQHKDNVSNSDMAKKLGQLCSKVANNQLHLIENDVEGNIQEKDVIDITNNLLSCGESEIAPNYEIFNETAVDIEITTKYPIRDDLSENNIEDYPEYVADDLIENHMDQFLEAAEKNINICRDMAKSLALVSPLDNEEPTYVKREDTIVGLFKSTGSNIAGIQFHQHNVTVRVSSFMETIDSIFSVQMCTYKKDPFWAVSKSSKIDTNVVDISITDIAEEVEIKHFGTRPMYISFGVMNHQLEKKTKTVNFLNHNNSKYPEDNFIIFVLKTKAKESFFIEFDDLHESDHIDAVVLDMERPALQHFFIAHSISKVHDRLFMENPVDEDKWFLLGLKRKMNEIHETSSIEVIHCRCLHLSTLAAYLEYHELKEHPKFIAADFFLEERKSLHICITVCITVGLYFFLLVYSIKKRETKEDTVYFLSDVPSQNRYCYLISIETGSKMNAGTTSDIVIQIFGTRGKSQEHVLNFPDPFLELLQRNQEDMFVLATSEYLGKLLKINLWFDCTGNSPNWYCKEVKICDVQKRKWFLFKVNKWLRVDGKPTLFLNVAVTSIKSGSRSETGFKNRFIRVISSIGKFENTLWSMKTDDDNPSFGLPKRMTLMLSVMLTLMTILIFFYGKPEMLPRDTITPKCYYTFDANALYVGFYSAFLTCLPHIALMEGFKRSRIQYDSSDVKKYPFAFTIIIWLILITNIFIQIHLLLIYGYWIIAPTSWQWTTSLLFALLFYILVLDYTFHLILISAGAVMVSGKMNYDRILKNVEYQRQHLYKFFGEKICRPILTPLYAVMNKTEYLMKYRFFRQKREVLWQMQDLMMIVLFIFFLYVIILEERDTTYDVLSHGEVLQLLEGNENVMLKLTRVDNMDEFENFMEHTFITTLQSYQWYGRYLSESPGLTTDACNRYLGIIRLRQHRAEYVPCNITTIMQFINRTCTSSSILTNLDFLNYTPSWAAAIPEFHRSRLGYVWGYQEETGESHYGVSGFYKKGGYVALLGRTMKNSIVNFEYLRRYSWMNVLTRAIFIELPLYNVNMNLFNFATIILEKTASGFIHKQIIVKPVRVVKESSQSTMPSLICTVLFMGLVFFIGIRTLLRIIRTKVWYKRDLWQLVDVGIISLSITWIVMYFRRNNILKNFVKELEENRSNTFIEYFDMIGVESWMVILASTLICVITLRIWRLLRFVSVFRIVERTLVYSFEPLIYCFLYFFILCIGFGIMGFVLFCTTSSNFKDGISTTNTLVLMTIGLRGPKTLHLENKNSVLGYVFIILFYSISYFLTTIFIAIIVVNFLKAQEFSFEETLEYNMKDYTKDKIQNVKRLAKMWIRKFRLKAGGKKKEDEELVTPKSNDVRYANCVAIDSNRMRAMASVAKCVLLKRKKGLLVDESDHALMMRTVTNLCNKEKGNDEFFFKQNTKTDGCKLVDNCRILLIEEVVKRMLESPEKRAERLKKIREMESLRAENTAKLEMMNYRLKSMLKVLEDITIQIASR